MSDKFILSITNFEAFNTLSAFPILEDIVVMSLSDYQRMKQAFESFRIKVYHPKLLLLKNTLSGDACIVNGYFYPLGTDRSEYMYPYVDHNDLPTIVPLFIVKGAEDRPKKMKIDKSQLNVFLSITDVFLDDGVPIRMYVRDY